MIEENDPLALHWTRNHEGFRSLPYLDTEGNWTFGFGFNIDAGISRDEAELLLRHRMRKAIRALSHYEWWSDLGDMRQRALAEMVYQLGHKKFSTFRKMKAALERRDFDAAADEMLDSLWARQTPVRAEHCAALMRTNAHLEHR